MGVALQGGPILTGGPVPKLDGLVATGGSYPIAAPVESHAIDMVLVSLHLDALLACLQVPQLDRAVSTARRSEYFAVPAECYGGDTQGVALKRSGGLAARHIW